MITPYKAPVARDQDGNEITARGKFLLILVAFGGFLGNMIYIAASFTINIYGLMTLSLLAGLFTDRTTLKLKEVFDVLLKYNRRLDHNDITLISNGHVPQMDTYIQHV